MNDRVFFILEGKNGSTYILNVVNWNSIKESLLFYKPQTHISRVLKKGLHIILWIISRYFSSVFKSEKKIQQYLQQFSSVDIDFQINNDCSVLISPTRDKIIVNHHKNYFQKFAFDGSYCKVRNESNIYNLFQNPLKYFKTSKQFDVDIIDNAYCSFKLSNLHLNKTNNNSIDFELALVEFFEINSGQTITVKDYLNKLLNKIIIFDQDNMLEKTKIIDELKGKYGNQKIPLGLVHRDFKPWNIMQYEYLLIFDFEETVTDGPPLEDLLNYIVDPILFKEIDIISNVLFKDENINSYLLYLEKLKINIDFEFFIQIYLINRMIFWRSEGKLGTSLKYQKLSNYIFDNSLTIKFKQ